MIKKVFNLRVGLLALWLCGFAFIATNLVLMTLFQDRIYPGVTIGSQSFGGMTRAEATSALQAQVKAYHLSLVVDGAKHSLKPQDIGAGYDVDLTVDQAFAAGRDTTIPIVGMLEAARHPSYSLAYSIDRTALSNFASSFVSQQVAAPVDATVVVSNGVPRVQPAKPGLGVNPAALVQALQQSIINQTELLTVERGPVPADISTDEAAKVADATKPLLATRIILTSNDKSFSPSSAEIGQWLVFAKQSDGTLATQVDQDQINNYLDSVASQVEVAAVTKQISVVNGETKGEEGGTDGLAINRTVLLPQIAAAVAAGKSTTLSIPTVPVAYKTVYNRTISLDTPRYIEVNLSLQHLWAYQDHQAVFDSPVTSGATGYGFPTVTGLFSIYAKETNRYLDGRPLGYSYNVFVQYWMPFYADYGLHDASWRNGVFGGQDYYYDGSHGCVNLPLATAAWLYNWASVGTPVWVHN